MTFIVPLPMRRFAIAAVLAAAVTTAVPMPGGAKDLGIHGATWPVAEPDLLVQIETRLHEMQRSGELGRFEAQARERTRRGLEEPPSIAGIVPAREHRTRLFDPAIVVAQDIRGPDGRLVAAAGTRIDPFAHAPLTRDLLFIDGGRKVEVAWAVAHGTPAKIVLLAGRPLDLMRRHGRPFFFDIGGRLTERFGLVRTPTLMTAEGAHLRLTEIPLDDRTPSDCAADPTEAGTHIQPHDRRQEPC